MPFAWRLAPAIGLLGLELACARGTPTASAVAPVRPDTSDESDAAAKPTPARDAEPPAPDTPATALRVVAAGDIACDGCGQSATAGLIEQLIAADHVTAVLALGDLAYSSGSAAEFRSFYAPAWGRPDILSISHPVPGNHEYASGSAGDYFDYFNGAGAAPPPISGGDHLG